MTKAAAEAATPALTTPLARYAHGRRVGDLLFVAGQGARDPATNQYAGVTRDASGKAVAFAPAAQTLAVLSNIERVLAAHGLTRADLVDVQVFLTSMAHFQEMNRVWNEFFADVPQPPTRTTIAVRDLPGDNSVEMKSIASFADRASREASQ